MRPNIKDWIKSMADTATYEATLNNLEENRETN